MIKEVDERLQMLNDENYDVQFGVKNTKEFIKDIMEYFEIEEDEVNEYYPIEDEEAKGEYVYSSLGAGIITLDEALDNEFTQAKENIEFYNQDKQKEILEWFYDEVEFVSYKFRIVEEEYKDLIELNDAKEYLLKTSMKELREEIQELQNKGYIIDFVEDTMRFKLTGDRDIEEAYFLVCK